MLLENIKAKKVVKEEQRDKKDNIEKMTVINIITLNVNGLTIQ